MSFEANTNSVPIGGNEKKKERDTLNQSDT